MTTKRLYSSLKDFLETAKINFVPAEKFFTNTMTIIDNGNIIALLASDELRNKVAERFEKVVFSKHNETRLRALKSGKGADFSQLHGFLIGLRDNGEYRFGNVLHNGLRIHRLGNFTWSALHFDETKKSNT